MAPRKAAKKKKISPLSAQVSAEISVEEHNALKKTILDLQGENQTLREKNALLQAERASSKSLTLQSLRGKLQEHLKGRNVDPILKLIDLSAAGNLKPSEEVNLWLKMAEFIYPKAKATEVSGKIDHEVKIVARQFVLDGANVKHLPDQEPIEAEVVDGD